MSTPSFIERYQERAKQHASFCFGIDPTPQLLSAWQLSDDLAGLQQFCDIVSQTFSCGITLIKPQLAFFERFGPEGLIALQALIQQAKKHDILVLADCKRGDISHTMLAYTQSMLGVESAFQADAMTVLPYMGMESMQASIDYADSVQAGLFVVIRSSNPEGAAVQDTPHPSGLSLAAHIAQTCEKLNQQKQQPVLHAVIGATLAKTVVQETVEQLPKSLYLTPGIGAQGASFDDVVASFEQAKSRVIATSSRGVLKHGPDVEALVEAIAREKAAARVLEA